MHVHSKHQQSLSCCALDTGSRYGMNCSTSDSRGYEEPVIRALWRSALQAVQQMSQQVCLPRSCWDLGAESMPKSGTEKTKRPAHHTSRWSVQDERRQRLVQRWTVCTMAKIPVCHFALGQGSALTEMYEMNCGPRRGSVHANAHPYAMRGQVGGLSPLNCFGECVCMQCTAWNIVHTEVDQRLARAIETLGGLSRFPHSFSVTRAAR